MSDQLNEGTIRMLAQVTSELGTILAANGRILGRAAENQWRQCVNGDIAYGEEAFTDDCDIIEGAAHRLRSIWL